MIIWRLYKAGDCIVAAQDVEALRAAIRLLAPAALTIELRWYRNHLMFDKFPVGYTLRVWRELTEQGSEYQFVVDITIGILADMARSGQRGAVINLGHKLNRQHKACELRDSWAVERRQENGIVQSKEVKGKKLLVHDSGPRKGEVVKYANRQQVYSKAAMLNASNVPAKVFAPAGFKAIKQIYGGEGASQ